MTDWNAIVLAGGRSSRLGADKVHAVFAGATLLEHALNATAAARHTVVVGPYARGATGASGAVFVTESPRFSGPASATIAGLDALERPRSRWTVVIAADLPYIALALPIVLAELDRAPVTGGIVAIDETGRRQPLLAVYDTAALALAGADARAHGRLDGLGMHALTAPITTTTVLVPSRLTVDIDTPTDAATHGIALPRLEAASHAG